jgi:hypothetical protein
LVCASAVRPSALREVGLALPLGQLVVAIQDPWFGDGWSFDRLAIPLANAVAASSLRCGSSGGSDVSDLVGMRPRIYPRNLEGGPRWEIDQDRCW